MEGKRRRYSMRNGVLNGFFLLSVAIFIYTTWKLVNDASSLDATTRNLMIAQVVFLGIGLIIEGIVVLGAFGVCLAAAAVCLVGSDRCLGGFCSQHCNTNMGRPISVTLGKLDPR